MNGEFVVLYAGTSVEFNASRDISVHLHGDPNMATIFESEGKAWLAVYKSGLTPWHTRVEPLAEIAPRTAVAAPLALHQFYCARCADAARIGGNNLKGQ